MTGNTAMSTMAAWTTITHTYTQKKSALGHSFAVTWSHRDTPHHCRRQRALLLAHPNPLLTVVGEDPGRWGEDGLPCPGSTLTSRRSLQPRRCIVVL